MSRAWQLVLTFNIAKNYVHGARYVVCWFGYWHFYAYTSRLVHWLLDNDAPLMATDKYWGPLLLTWIKFNPSMDNYIYHTVWDEITYPFIIFNSAIVEF